jgi:gliding motility-associated-like protein
VLAGEPVQVTGSYGPSVTTWSWIPDQGINCSDCPNPVLNPLQTTVYTLTVFDALGCSESATAHLIVDDFSFFVPNVLMMNSMIPENAAIYFYSNNPESLDQFHFRIFDRWGELVFETNDPSQGWFGEYKGQPVRPGVFSYFIDFVLINGERIDTKEIHRKGTITVIR